MQVAADDDYDDYVICRGFDTRIRAFVDYESGNADKPGIFVAKPFGKRVKCYYNVGEVYPAFLPFQHGTPSPADVPWRTGQNPGVAETSCLGQPQKLNVTIDELTDENSVYVNWMLIDSGTVFFWVRLLEDLSACGTASATTLMLDVYGDFCDPCTTITVEDQHGVVPGSAIAENDVIPAGSHALVMGVSGSLEFGEDRLTGCKWVPVTFGTGECCEGSGSDSSESESSESESSESSGDSSVPSDGDGDSSSGSSKDTAIVPASWTKDGYAALFVVEDPQVRFEDVLIVDTKTFDQIVILDPRFVEVCEPNTIEVCGVSSNLPVSVGASVKNGNTVELRFPWHWWKQPTRVVVKLTGIRRGFKGVRFPAKTKADFEANEKWIRRTET